MLRPGERESFRAGVRVGIPLAAASLLLGASFGVLAEPVMGSLAPIVMSAIVFAGSAQFAATAVLADGGGAATAIVAGILLNARFLPMGIALGPSVHGRAAWRALVGQAIIDASWALANRGRGRFDVAYMLGATIVNYPAWVGGTVIGVLAGEAIGNPDDLGLDALFPAFFLGLLANELRGPAAVAAAAIGAGVALALTPFTPPGVPVLAACLGALVGLVEVSGERRRREARDFRGGGAADR
jgi:4-azaleucine resistance transporter AzlC